MNNTHRIKTVYNNAKTVEFHINTELDVDEAKKEIQRIMVRENINTNTELIQNLENHGQIELAGISEIKVNLQNDE